MSEIRVTNIIGENGSAAVNFSKGINISSGIVTATSFSGSASGLTGSSIAAKLSDQRPSMKGITLTDDGTSNPVLDLKVDDDNPWGMIIGNATYSTNQRGLKFLQENGGQVNIRTSGEGSYVNLNFTQDDGSSSRTLVTLGGSGEVVLRHQGNLKMVTTSTGISVTGSVSDSDGPLRGRLPVNAQGTNYTLVASDAGKFIRSGGGNITINPSIFSTGDMVTILNDTGGNITIIQGSSFSLINSADASTGNRTLAQRGLATVLFNAQNQGYISGSGLS